MTCGMTDCGEEAYKWGLCRGHCRAWGRMKDITFPNTTMQRHWVRFGEKRRCPQLRCPGKGEILAPLNRLEDPYLFFCLVCHRAITRDRGEGVTGNILGNSNRMRRLTAFHQMHRIGGRPEYGWEGELLNV